MDSWEIIETSSIHNDRGTEAAAGVRSISAQYGRYVIRYTQEYIINVLLIYPMMLSCIQRNTNRLLMLCKIQMLCS